MWSRVAENQAASQITPLYGMEPRVGAWVVTRGKNAFGFGNKVQQESMALTGSADSPIVIDSDECSSQSSPVKIVPGECSASQNSPVKIVPGQKFK